MQYPYFRIIKSGVSSTVFNDFNEMINNTESISDYLEDSENRETTVTADKLKIKLSSSSAATSLVFAGKNSNVHFYTPNSGAENFFVNLIPSTALTKGFSPLARATDPSYALSTLSKVFVGNTCIMGYPINTSLKMYYRNNGKGIRDFGTIEIRNASTQQVYTRYTNCPANIIVGLQGAGGGGSNGRVSYYSDEQGGQGGQAGGFTTMSLYLPTSATSNYVEVASFIIGKGGVHNTTGGNGGSTSALVKGVEYLTSSGGLGGVNGKPKTNSNYYYTNESWFLSNSSTLSGATHDGVRAYNLPANKNTFSDDGVRGAGVSESIYTYGIPANYCAFTWRNSSGTMGSTNFLSNRPFDLGTISDGTKIRSIYYDNVRIRYSNDDFSTVHFFDYNWSQLGYTTSNAYSPGGISLFALGSNYYSTGSGITRLSAYFGAGGCGGKTVGGWPASPDQGTDGADGFIALYW